MCGAAYGMNDRKVTFAVANFRCAACHDIACRGSDMGLGNGYAINGEPKRRLQRISSSHEDPGTRRDFAVLAAFELEGNVGQASL
jgi:hypothetical protein